MNIQYCSNYCEENIYRLCEEFSGRQDVFSIFISNSTAEVACFHQKLAPEPDAAVLWDYHVVLLEGEPGQKRIWDLDSRLGQTTPALFYLERTFPELNAEYEYLRPRFRMVPASEFLQLFASSREHMKNGDDWLSPPPPWPPIGKGNNLNRFLDFDDDIAGRIYSLSQLRDFLL